MTISSSQEAQQQASGPFTIEASDPGSRARSGTLHTAHGTVQTPAFVPLATRASVKTLTGDEVSALGYRMVFGNTYHLMLQPGSELIAKAGGLHEFMRWDHPIITDSGGFQVFSMGHGTVADEVKGRTPGGRGPGAKREGSIIKIAESGVTFRSYIDGSIEELTPERSMKVQAELGSDIALVFDECTPFNVTREYTAKSTERTHRWLQRCLNWHRENASPQQLVYGIVQGGVYEDLRTESAAYVAASECPGIAIGGSLGQDKQQMREVIDMTTAVLPDEKPRHLLGIGEIDDLIDGVALGIDSFDCAMPSRLARHGVALVPDPDRRFRLDLSKGEYAESPEPVIDGFPSELCRRGYSRAYLRHLFKLGELAALRLVTEHNLLYVRMLMDDLRDAINNGTLAQTSAELRAGALPGSPSLTSA